MTEGQVLKIPNRVITSLGLWLKTQMLIGSQSRMRSRFLNLIGERILEIEKTRVELCEKYAEKDENGSFLYYTEDGGKGEKATAENGKFNILDNEKFLNDTKEYYNEEFLIDVTQANIGTIIGVRDILLSTKTAFPCAVNTGRGNIIVDADTYDIWCLALEAIV